jgi:two-component system, OmpR family, phosphate regulon response regulator PhoB
MHAVGAMILLVEDDAAVRATLVDILGEHGFEVIEAASGGAARTLAAARRPDVILLDLGLPDMTGLDLLGTWSAEGVAPVIVLSGRTGEFDRVVCLDLGADDYVGKPFSSRELVSRINAVIRRTRRQQPSSQLVFGSLTIDTDSREVALAERSVSLTAKEFDLLTFLARSPRQVFTRAQLLHHVWGSSPRWQDEKTVAEHVHRVRRKLDDQDRERWIQTVRGVGYRFAPALAVTA